MTETVRTRKGFDIRLEGKAQKQVAKVSPVTFAVKPTDFVELTQLKLLVAEKEHVQAGTALFYDKTKPAVQYCAPVSGEVVKVLRGEKRKILEIIILPDRDIQYEPLTRYTLQEITALTRAVICEKLCKSGAFPHLLQRPYGTVANPADTPQALFISAFDSHPLAPDATFVLSQDEKAFEAGLAALKRLTSGELYMGLPKGVDSSYFAKQKEVKYYQFQGPHPAGNVGVQIHHIRPIGKGDVLWTTTPYGVVQIGRVLLEGRYDTSTRIALTGPEVLQPQYYQTHAGASISRIVQDNTRSTAVRYISGDVLTGERVSDKGHMGFYDQQLSVIAEGNYRELFGWIRPSTQKLSTHRALGLLSFLFPNKRYGLDTNMHGEARAFAQTGVFERVMPMDILPTHLIKAILAEDYDDMEALGIYEVIEEDMALCEFVDLSKHEIQKILREGLTLMSNS